MRYTVLDRKLEELGYFRQKSVSVEGSWLLYDIKSKEYYSAFCVEKDGRLKTPDGTVHNTVEDFLFSVREYNSRLYFPIRTYNPDYRQESVDEMRLHAIMVDCGLYCGDGYQVVGKNTYYLKNELGENVARVSIDIDSDGKSEVELFLDDSEKIVLKCKEQPVNELNCRRIKMLLDYVYSLPVHLPMNL